ncbi:alpha-glucuronidase family glycosyl hydrolase [Lewinella sp. W8]|uniref:alpha-glucuronidase family glycosyl hydrolase n=1 Tax=Lewinella sp. W8 TaxID=2528208 RepID=UPI0010677939|nr:alpha-glucuronidase family glycosyl hydrolase [Lewinella sp. W8]MTB50417.1 alpha-glucuronidase [Lewinella sp. W8]
MRNLLFFIILSASFGVKAEDGYRLWLRHDLIEDTDLRTKYVKSAAFVHCEEVSLVAETATRELRKGLGGLLGITLFDEPGKQGDQGVYLGIRGKSSRIEDFLKDNNVPDLGSEGYHLAADEGDLLIIADDDKGLLYGAFDLLQMMSRGESLATLNRTERPAYEHRILNHWDNLDRTVERGYAGFSIWNWHQLPDFIDQRYVDYARANASVGINGTVVTNVNANSLVFRDDYLDKAAALADVFRPYGIKLYLTARFSSPMELGGLETADPLDPEVMAWWKDKVEEIYARIPDFGGFLVKANSEGQPGPREYGRSHAEGANMLADALEPHGGIVMWRAFVYTDKEGGDRFREAYDEFRPLDGKFRKNVMLQIKNGPIDFQPREPVSPLFAAMPRTPLLLELQITKEYLGQGTHTVGLASMYEEILTTDMHPEQAGGKVHELVSGIAGVSNIGTARNWTGNLFGQADWYAFGRLSWSPETSARTIFRDWSALTFGTKPTVVDRVTQMLTISYPACVNYMTPMGLHHIMATGHHYGPGPWVNDLGRDDWNPYYYHWATKDSVGFDRTATGSGALSQYPPAFAKQYEDPDNCPPEFLLWFHRVPWSMTLANGNDLWREIGLRYQRGVDQVDEMQKMWNSLKADIDPERFVYAAQHLNIQRKEAAWWRDACLSYFHSVNARPLPHEVPVPARSLQSYVDEFYPYSPGIRPRW